MNADILHFSKQKTAALVLADGAVFFGFGFGAQHASTETVSIGEMCFHTGMTGYQETLTDPSFARQIITFTFPHIGNVGCNAEDMEAKASFASGLVTRELPTEAANYRAETDLQTWLEQCGLTGIAGVDTRALTRYIRKHGAQNGVIYYPEETPETFPIEALQEKAQSHPAMEGQELASVVSCTQPYEWTQTCWQWGRGFDVQSSPKYHVVAVDFGAKLNILRCLAEVGCKVTVVPAKSTAEEILGHNPDGVFLSNGPGDPAETSKYAAPVIQEILSQGLPIFGICLGHQLLASALGCKTEKMEKGHRGANQPVQDRDTGRVEITSQNHGFVVVQDSLPEGVEETHCSLFDGTNEGIQLKGRPVFSVQHHPEASPGPHDSFYLFERFAETMAEAKKQKVA